MRRVLPLVFALAVGLVAVLAPAALAHDGGQGTIGEANDKIVTNAGFIVIAAIPLIILIASTLQWRLDKRKHARMAAKQHRSTGSRWRGGW
jgi:hypothetical protein